MDSRSRKGAAPYLSRSRERHPRVSIWGVRLLSRQAIPLLPALVVGVFAAAPILFVVWQALQANPSHLADLVFRPRVGQLLRNTFGLAVLVTGTCLVVGTAAAWLTERTDLRGAFLWRVLLVLPIAVPEFVNGYTWVALWPDLQGLVGAVLVSSISLYPLVYLPVAAMLRRQDSTLTEVASSLGLSRRQVFLRVFLPGLAPALLGGSVIVSLHLLGEYGAFALLRYPTFAVAIFNEYRLGFDPASAAALSVILILLCLLVTSGSLIGREAGRARVGGGTGRPEPIIPLQRKQLLAQLLLVTGAIVTLGVPAWSLVRWLWVGTSTTLPSADVLKVLGNTLFYGTATAVVATVLVLPVAFTRVSRPGRFSRALTQAIYIDRALPGIVLALALAYVALRFFPALYQSSPLLVASYALMTLPLALVPLTAVLSQLPSSLPAVARSLGRSRPYVMVRIILPILLPGMAAAAALAFLTTVTELTATLLLHPTGVRTLATQFWVYTAGQSYGAAAPYAALMIVVSLPATLLLARALTVRPGDRMTGSLAVSGVVDPA